MVASDTCTSASIPMAQPHRPAIDSKTFTDRRSLPLLSRIRTVPLPPDGVKRWAHFHRDGSLGAWSCLIRIIAHVFASVNFPSLLKWVWETDFENFLWTVFQSGVCRFRLIEFSLPAFTMAGPRVTEVPLYRCCIKSVMQVPRAYQCSWICRTNRWIAAKQQRDVPDWILWTCQAAQVFFSLYY